MQPLLSEKKTNLLKITLLRSEDNFLWRQSECRIVIFLDAVLKFCIWKILVFRDTNPKSNSVWPNLLKMSQS